MQQVIFCTCPDQASAEVIANQLVTMQLAACVNILPNLVSIYQWQGNVQKDNEVLMMIKSDQQHFAALATCIKQNHPYDVPEVIALDIQQGDNDYLNWINQSLK